MNREIKFKLWDTEKKKWHISRDFLLDLDGEVLFNICGGASKCEYNCRNQIKCEFTGLKDKNGREIYEGDLLKNILGGEIKEVIFQDGTFTYKETYYDSDGLFYCDKNWEITGNIFENPELLK